MTGHATTRISLDDIAWPDPVVIPAERVVDGRPTSSTVIIHESAAHQFGLWRATPGAFTTDHTGYLEYIHILGGSGRLISDDGAITELAPGLTVLMPSGWKGRWVVDSTLTKTYSIVHPPLDGGRA